jgi:hypothetical protein
MRRNRSSKKRIDTTLGELIAALSEVAFEHCKDAKEAYTLAGLVLADVLSNCLRSDVTPSQSRIRDRDFSSTFTIIGTSIGMTVLFADEKTAQLKGV